MQISDKGLALIRHFEGFRARAYYDIVGVLTIGYGRTHGVREGDVTTEQAEDDWMRAHCAEVGRQIDAAVVVPLGQHQFDALVSFAYNVGIGAFRDSTLLRLLNEGLYDDVPAQLARWDKAGGKVVAGLARRREAEADLWSEGAAVAELEQPKGNSTMQLGKYAKAIGGAVAGLAVWALATFAGVNVDGSVVVEAFGLDDAIYGAVSALMGAAGPYFAPKNAEA